MDKRKATGIYLEHIDLTSCSVGEIDTDADLRYELGLVAKSRHLSDDGKNLVLALDFDLMHGVTKPPFSFKCSFLAFYSKDEENANMTWDEFRDVLALAHVIPYLRELISNITNRLPIPVLMLPPTNAFKLVEDHDERVTRKASKSNIKAKPHKATGKKRLRAKT